MKFTPDGYLDAAWGHWNSALMLFRNGEKGVAVHFLCGLAVECTIRAYLTRRSAQYESRHDLIALSKEADFHSIFPRGKKDFSEYTGHLAEVYRRWNSNHRFASNDMLRNHLKRMGLDRRTKGDLLKENCRQLLNSSEMLITRGRMKWTSARS